MASLLALPKLADVHGLHLHRFLEGDLSVALGHVPHGSPKNEVRPTRIERRARLCVPETLSVLMT